MMTTKILVGIAAAGSAGVSGTYAIWKIFFKDKGQSSTGDSQASSGTPSSIPGQTVASPVA